VPAGFLEGDLTPGNFPMATLVDREVFSWGGAAAHHGNDRCFITRDFNRGSGKENGTIPFYPIFLTELTKLSEL
jgi:hypothetical protein